MERVIIDLSHHCQSFQRHQRLLSQLDFSSVFDNRRAWYGRSWVMLTKPNDLTHARLGLVVSKKVSKSSVRRNFMKRLGRELFRQHNIKYQSLDIIVIGKKNTQEDGTSLRKDLSRLFTRLQGGGDSVGSSHRLNQKTS